MEQQREWLSEEEREALGALALARRRQIEEEADARRVLNILAVVGGAIVALFLGLALWG